MRKFVTMLLMVTMMVSAMPGAYASSITAENIFNTIGGSTTIDRGGAIHSQARSIYSLGGGMTSFKGKRVSLLAADPPSFSAGCSGISWHFGGFAFISVDEIRQLVEAVAQASLGVAVDLAMQTLCPQCYAVMAKLRDIANAMRNASADACKIAKNFGAMLQEKGIFSSDQRITSCSQVSAEKGESDGFMGAMLNPCKTLTEAEGKIKEYSQGVMDFLEGGNKAVAKTPTKDALDAVGNITYDALSALGYPDGFIKDMMLSFTGMALIDPVPNADCRTALKDLLGSSVADSTSSAEIDSIIGETPESVVVPTSNTAQPTTADAKTTDSKTEAPQGKTSKMVCFAPPLISGISMMAEKLLCGFNPASDMITFSTKYNLNVDEIANTSIGAMCNSRGVGNQLAQGPVQGYSTESKDSKDPYLYHCEEKESAQCTRPKMVRMSKALYGQSSVGQYTGLAWMVMDSLYAGVDAVEENKPLPARTISLLNGSGYPLYRLINLAAVYPGMANELLDAYGSVIATHYALDTLQAVSRPGVVPAINTRAGKGGLPRQEVRDLHRDIMQMVSTGDAMREQTMKRLSSKRALVDTIVQVNRALQAEVISQGLSGNADLAVSIKRQATAREAAATGPQQP